MRTSDFGTGAVIRYPNPTQFAFSPAIIEIERQDGNDDLFTAEVTLAIGGDTYTEKRISNKGHAVFDIMSYIQMLLAEVDYSVLDYGVKFQNSPLVRDVSVTVTATGLPGAGTQLTFDMTCVWGCMDAGEVFGGEYRRTWWPGYPFTFDVASQPLNYFDVSYDDNPVQAVAFEVPAGDDRMHHYIVNPAEVFSIEGVNRDIYVAIPNALHIKDDIEGVGVTSYRLTLDRCGSGVYLRWIDRQGRYEYYLFKQMGEGCAVTVADSFFRNDMLVPAQFVDGVNRSIRLRQIFERKDTLQLVAPLVDGHTFGFLLSLGQSPVVDMFVGYDSAGVPMWKRVAVTAREVTRTNAHLQDFTVSIQLPEKNMQVL